ncbi:TonB family protein [Mesorhizobium sp. M4B.F.Ca.ET.215.01.1.1]|uniref:TonB family protein n=1 Tax=Mesorhizobium TaxID=68287 RepID=UPI000FCA6C91|nr:MULTISPECIES: energy transducer TonB [unclassified Mesorhizobium]RUW27196.1 TonB family protein [Mesorhizobium sp. M4B.F.Ca.ET.013.02.1.1]RVD44057.1 TonB family protein [Mesorhizobium sp. M4B.F.Ca.ET.019.03.1.1]TGQ10630.1 TonB family protein [Mesorhizobium sp. M4B.F.Ca.ET.215.01.1.1]TGQ38134.1 TonB family protein [Mesorhizobium sp. M00.F.Ca.ET.220.01.1.1]TGR03667.1 TonB family protein [Mesorhizobium sp. M4B.F.Ca.ET.203.01.1.1]
MTGAAAALSGIGQPRFGVRETGLWAAAAALILIAHVAVAYAVQSFNLADSADGGPPPALAIEMSPLAVAPAVQEEALVPDTVMPDQAEPVEETETVTAVKPVTEPAPEPVTEEAEPTAEQPVEAAATAPAAPTVAALSEQQPLDEVVPDVVETVAPEVVIPLPQPKPVDAPAEPKKPVEAKAKKPVDKQQPKKEKPAPAKTAMAASVDARRAARTAAPKATEGAQRFGAGPARWNSSLAAWIRRHTRYPSAARSRRAEGNPNVTFTVDSSGRVVSARLARSSGDADLDRAALGALQGASVPAPPPELGARVTRTAPFVFSLRN